MREAVILSAVRLPTGKFLGALKGLPATRLGSMVVKEAVSRAGIAPDLVDEVILGNVISAGLGQAPARQAALGAGLPPSVAALTVNKVCGSGLKAVMLAAQGIAAGDVEVVVAGGMESMSNCPYLLLQAREGFRMGNGKVLDSMISDGLWDAYADYHMGMTGEIVAEKYGVSRQEQDAYAVASHRKAIAAIKAGKFKGEILPVPIAQKKGDPVLFATDESPREDTSLEALGKLKPAFSTDGIVTAGNSSQTSDGAAASLILSAEKAKELGVAPVARLLAYAVAGVPPEIMGIGPVEAIPKALKRAGLKLQDIDLIELNEAFASQSVAVIRELEFDPAIVNVNGGAIALGHPLGCTGAKLTTQILYEMKRRKARYGMVTMCIGGGMGAAGIFENLN